MEYLMKNNSYRNLSHVEARRLIQFVLDGVVVPQKDLYQRTQLDEHLARCNECRAYAQTMGGLDGQLNQQLPQTWPERRRSKLAIDQAIDHVKIRYRRRKMFTLIAATAKRTIWASIFVLAMFGLVWVIGNTSAREGAPADLIETLPVERVGEKGISAQEPSTSSEEDENQMSIMPANEQQIVTEASQVAVPGEIYFVLRKTTGYRFARLPVDCLLGEEICPRVEQIPGFPETEFSYGTMSWSPDGKKLIIIDASNPGLLVFLPQDNSFKVIDLPVSLMSILWSPDSRWVAVNVQGLDSVMAHLLLVNERGEQHNLAVNLDGYEFLYPVGWAGPDDLIAIAEKLDYPDNDPSKKKVVIDRKLITVNIQTSGWQQLPVGNELSVMDAHISPDGSLLVYYSTENKENQLYGLKPGGIGSTTLTVHTGSPIWSPDMQWIASADGNETTCKVNISRPDNSEVQQFTFPERGFCNSITWLPDNATILVGIRDSLRAFDIFYVASLDDNTSEKVEIPGLQGYAVEGLALRTIPGP